MSKRSATRAHLKSYDLIGVDLTPRWGLTTVRCVALLLSQCSKGWYSWPNVLSSKWWASNHSQILAHLLHGNRTWIQLSPGSSDSQQTLFRPDVDEEAENAGVELDSSEQVIAEGGPLWIEHTNLKCKRKHFVHSKGNRTRSNIQTGKSHFVALLG